MKRFRLGFLSILLSLLVPMTCGCDDESPAGSGGHDLVADATDTPADPSTDQPTTEPTTDQPDQVAPDTPTDDLGPGECTVNTSGITNPANYATDTGGTRPAVLRIEWVDFINDRIGVRNIGTEPIDFDDSWRVNTNGQNSLMLGRARDLAPGALLRIRMLESGLADDNDVYLNGGNSNALRSCGGEIAIIDLPENDSPFTDCGASCIQAFIMWGTRRPYGGGPGGDTFNEEAVAAGEWSEDLSSSSYAVPTCYEADSGNPEYNASSCSPFPECDTYNTQGLLAVGDVTDPEDWQSVDSTEAGCFF